MKYQDRKFCKLKNKEVIFNYVEKTESGKGAQPGQKCLLPPICQHKLQCRRDELDCRYANPVNESDPTI